MASSVSVVIPCYNYGRFLPEAVASVLDDQPGVDVRVLIIDDASTDDSAEVARKLAAGDPRVEVAVHPVNRGHIATYNEGLLDWAEGDYCVLFSADDRLAPGSLRRAADLLDTRPGIGFVYGHPLWFVDGTPPPRPRTHVRGWSVWPGQWWLERRFRAASNCITSPEVVVRTSAQKLVGGYDSRLPHAADLEMWLRLAAHGEVGFLRGVDQAYHRMHGKNMMSSYNALADLRQRRLAFEIAGDSWPTGLREATYPRLARDALGAAVLAYDRAEVADDLVEFALDCWPGASGLPVYRALRLLQRIGPRGTSCLRPFVTSPVMNKAQGWLRRRSWKWRGY